MTALLFLKLLSWRRTEMALSDLLTTAIKIQIQTKGVSMKRTRFAFMCVGGNWYIKVIEYESHTVAVPIIPLLR